MGDYLESLDKVQARGFDTLWPTHGPPVTQVEPFLLAYKAHRLQREAQILARLETGPQQIVQLVPALYAGVDQGLWPAAAQSVLAHLLHLVASGRAASEGGAAAQSVYRIV